MSDDLLSAYEAISETFALPRGRRWDIGPRPAVMGILNVTPDSFSDGGRNLAAEDAVRNGLRMIEDGADVLDIGGESTRPGAREVSVAEQIARVEPVIRGLRAATDVPLSIDTRSPAVGRAALDAGADIINDVSACTDPDWIPLLIDRADVPVILMHMRGTPETMKSQASYDDVVADVCDYLSRRVDDLSASGVARERLIVDPGIGFAKDAQQNIDLVRGLGAIRRLGRPVLFGASRKIFLGRILEASGRYTNASELAASPGAASAVRSTERNRDPKDRDVGTVAVNAFALLGGAAIVRVHNVAHTRDLVDVFEVLLGPKQSFPTDGP